MLNLLICKKSELKIWNYKEKNVTLRAKFCIVR